MENREVKASTAAKREKKRAGREAKAARKAANQVEEKKSRPNNIVLTIMIFGVLILMFAFVTGYNYFSKAASIEKYIEDNGGEDSYGSVAIDEFTTANITAEKNSMKIVFDTEVDDDLKEDYVDFYTSEIGEQQLKYVAAYYLGGIKPNTRGFSGDVTITANVNGEEAATESLTYKEAKDILENGFEDESDEDADADTGEGEDDADAGDAEEEASGDE